MFFNNLKWDNRFIHVAKSCNHSGKFMFQAQLQCLCHKCSHYKNVCSTESSFPEIRQLENLISSVLNYKIWLRVWDILKLYTVYIISHKQSVFNYIIFFFVELYVIKVNTYIKLSLHFLAVLLQFTLPNKLTNHLNTCNLKDLMIINSLLLALK